MRGAKPQLGSDEDAVKRVPYAPKWLSPHAQAEWRRVVPVLVAKRILTEADLSSLENYCVAQGRIRELEADVQTTRSLDAKARLVRMQDKAMQTARQIAAELGLTPMARS